jgi:hypothetical protein
MAQTVTQFPPNIIAETRVKVSCGNGTKSLYEQNRPTASGFPFHNSPSLDYQVPCYSGHGHGPPASSTQTLIVMCHLRNEHQRQHLKMEMKGEAMVVMNLTPTPPSLLICSILDENFSQS